MGRRAAGACALLHRRRLLRLPALDGRLCAASEPGHPRGARRLPAAPPLRAHRQPSAAEARPQRASSGRSASSVSRRALSLGLLRRAAASSRRSEQLGHRGRRGRGRARLRRRAIDDGLGASDHLRALPRLRHVRSAPAFAAQPSRLRFLADHRHALPRHRRHLRHADLRLLHLHLPVHPVRRVPGARRHDRPFHRRRARHGRP